MAGFLGFLGRICPGMARALCLWTVSLAPAQAGWFSDNGERVALAPLRQLPPEQLTKRERALLTAANRTGWVWIPACGMGSNGVLVRAAGQDYIITSLHLLIGKYARDRHCDPGDAAFFYPNAAYREPGQPRDKDAFTEYAVPLLPMPVNYSGAGVAMPWVSDWVAYRPEQPLSDAIMPEGTWQAGALRGAFTIPEAIDPAAPVTVLGYDSRFEAEQGWQFSWQDCRQRHARIGAAEFFIDCDIAPGASSSPVMALFGEEMVLLGIVSASMEKITGPNAPVPELTLLWNIATSAAGMRAELEADAEGEGAQPFGTLRGLFGLPER